MQGADEEPLLCGCDDRGSDKDEPRHEDAPGPQSESESQSESEYIDESEEDVNDQHKKDAFQVHMKRKKKKDDSGKEVVDMAVHVTGLLLRNSN